MVEIRWSDGALEDLDNIADYISQDSPKNAALFIQQIFDKVENLRSFPKMGRKYLERDDENLREFFHKKYRIIYEIHEEYIEILIVVHGSRIIKF